MPLQEYNQKRDFKVTSEPKGSRARKRGSSFVVQKHAARRLHYDLRLEMDGVLRSWAVTRGPSLVVGEKRLAVHVEDHPLSYGDFEGTIPRGEYGAGTVIVWDRGTWSAIGDAAKGYAKGHLVFELAGEKLGGRWHLVKMQGKATEKRENWLLIKAEDDFARTEDAPDILQEQPHSIKTGRDIEDVASLGTGAPPAAPRGSRPVSSKGGSEDDPTRLKGAKRAKMPDFIAPMLATLATTAPAGERWLHEIKFDGYRLQARIDGGKISLLTRSGLDWTDRFGEGIVDALASVPAEKAIIDGEVVVEAGSGASDFSALQADLSEGRTDRFVFYAFDLMYLDNTDLRGVNLSSRKGLLETLLSEAAPPLRYSTHFDASGLLVLRHACRLSLEGIISKLADGPYRTGRVKSWMKSKCSARQEFVIAGYTTSTTSSDAIGSLILGVHEGDALQYVGRVGTGFTAKVAREIFARLEPLVLSTCPFDAALTAAQARKVHYVRPELVAEVEFRAWTADGNLRHASFRGLREDKPAAEIVREGVPGKATPPPRRTVKLTHPDRIYWPDAGITKEGLADYYSDIWREIAPFVVNRPLALLRCPEGINGPSFFQKHAWRGINPKIALVSDPKSKADDPLISINDLDGLIALVQAASLELHPWGATLDDWERPDTIVMDLDPGDGVAWSRVIDAAQEIRQRLSDAGLTGFVKTSGGKGLHVVAPLKPHAQWTEVKAFTKAMALEMAADAPDRYVATVTKAKRKGKILIDYLRNQRGATAVAAYSPRARPGAAVSTPIRWEELGADIGPDHFTIGNLANRLAMAPTNPWDGFFAAQVPLRAR